MPTPNALSAWMMGLALAACGANHRDPAPDPSSASPSDEPAAPTRVEPPPTGDCAPTAVIYRQTSTPLNNPEAPVWTLLLHDSGAWSVDGIGEDRDASGCLEADTLASLQSRIDVAEVVADPLGPGEARCMAMPVAELAVEVRGARAAWTNPCGPARPSDTLAALIEAVAAATYQP